jgi:hypothetical protein
LLKLLENGPALVREFVKPAEKIAEIKVLQVGGSLGGAPAAHNGSGPGAGQFPLLGNALGPVARSIFEASAVLPVLKEVMRFAEVDKLRDSVTALAAEAPRAPATAPVPPPLPTSQQGNLPAMAPPGVIAARSRAES